MELKDIINNYGLIGVISNYKSTFKLPGKVKELDVKNISNALLMVGLNDSYLEKDITNLTINELWKIELMTKLNKEIIIMGNLSKCLNYKEKEYIKKLLIKLHSEYHKKIVIVDNDVKVFMDFVKLVVVLQNKDIIYQTNDYFSDELYNYTKMPKIVEFIKYINKDGNKLKETTDIYELIKDIYRSVS